MKLNNKGWGFKEMFVFMAVLIVFLILIVYLIYSIYNRKELIDFKGNTLNIPSSETNQNGNTTISPYADLEIRIKDATVTYVRNYYNKEINAGMYVSVKTLKQVNLLNDLYDLKDLTPCSGYTKVIYENGILKYYPYLKCSHYTTSGYEGSYDL